MPSVLDLKHPEPVEEDDSAYLEAETLPVVSSPMPTAAELAAALMSSGPEEVAWESDHSLPEHAHFRHFLLMSVVGIVGVLLSWWQRSWLTFFAVFTGLVAWELRERMGKPLQVRINRAGVWVDGSHFPHADLTSFDIHQLSDDSSHVSIKTKYRLNAHLHLPLGQQDPEEVRALLSRHVPEERHDVPLLEWWLRKR